MSLMSIMPEELKSLLLATAKDPTHLTYASSTIPYSTYGRDTTNSKGSTYLQMLQCSSKIQSLTQLSYPTRKTPAEQEDAMLVATVGGTLEYCWDLQADRTYPVCKNWVSMIAFNHQLHATTLD